MLGNNENLRFRNTPSRCLLIVALLTTVGVSANITLHSCIITTVAAGKPITDSLQLIDPPLQKLPADLKENPKYCCITNYPTEFLFSLSYILVCFCFTLLLVPIPVFILMLLLTSDLKLKHFF